MLDADNVAVTDPAPLFDSRRVRRHGHARHPRPARAHPREPDLGAVRGALPQRAVVEAGQMVVDKSRCWPALQMVLGMNERSDLFYPHTHGDKDTFHLAWIVAGVAWSMPAHPARAATTGIFQRGFDGALFEHRSQREMAPDRAQRPRRRVSPSGRLPRLPRRAARSLEWVNPRTAGRVGRRCTG